MKHTPLKTALSLLLALLLAATSLSVSFASNEQPEDPVPVIYVIGRTAIYDDPASPDRRTLAKAGSDEIEAAVKEALPYAAKAVLFGQWDEYADETYGLLMQFFDGYALDENGNVANSSGNDFHWSEETLPRDYQSDNPYTYRFEYDARLSPLEVADQLNDFIEAVKRVTGKDKVSIIGRCLGACVMMAYLYKYQEGVGFTGVENVCFYDSSFHGIEMLEAAMSGSVTIEADAASAFLDGYDLETGEEALDVILPLTLTMLEETYGMELTVEFLEKFYENIKYSLFRRFLMSSLGTAPGYWSMVYEGYDDAKAYLFCDEGDDVKYAGLIAKLDDYRENVQLRGDEILAGMEAAGVGVGVVCKYGFRGYPVYEGASELSDGVTGLKKQSFGATVSTIDGTLGKSYIAAKQAEGLGDYISPDRQIDASTCRFADSTWFIKNYEHNPFWDCVNPLLVSICRKEGFNVKDDPRFPQFMYLESSSSVVPMTEENADPDGQITHEGSEPVKKDPLMAFVGFLKYLAELFRLFAEAFASGQFDQLIRR
ncbi:MAG: hypothetical protein IK104_06345 [Clostridia bacterium]|nr:hypothetical protein [Clostridia bacterium]